MLLDQEFLQLTSRIRGVLGEEPLAAVLSDDRSKLMKQITSLAEAEEEF